MTERARDLADCSRVLMMEMIRKGAKPNRRERVLMGFPVGVQKGVLRKASGAIFSARPVAQKRVVTDKIAIEAVAAWVKVSSSRRVRIRLIVVKKKRTREMMVVVFPGSRKASTRLGVFINVESSHEAASAKRGMPKGERTMRTCLSATKLPVHKSSRTRVDAVKRACLLNS